MDTVAVLSRALDQTGGLLDRVGADVLERPTPCPEWDVSALADHLINDPHQFLLMMRGGQPDWSAPTPHVSQAWGSAFRVAADDLVRAWRDLGDDSPLPAAMQFAEFAVHDWDLATALGLPLDGLDPRGGRARPRVHAGQPDSRDAESAFGPEQPAPPGAGAYDRIAAFAGRHVTR